MKIKRTISGMGIVMLSVTILFLIGFGPTPTMAVMRLTAASHFPPPSGQSKLVESFLKEVEAKTGGQVEVTYYPGGSLLGPTKIFEGTAGGLADIGMAGLHFTPGRFPVMTTLYNPFGYPSAWVATHVVNDFYNKFKPKELDGVQTLFLHASAPLIFETKKPVRRLEDLRGFTIRSTDLNNQIVSALGAVPRNMPIPEAYDGAAKGLIDGFLLPPETLKVWHLADVTKYVTFSWGVSSCDTFVVAINKTTWNKLPKSVQKVFADLSGEYIEKASMMWETVNKEGYEEGKKRGMEYITLSPEEMGRWKKAVSSVTANYVNKQVSAGFPKNEAEAYVQYIQDRINYFYEQQKKSGIDVLGFK